jgi:hypothetical protein
MTPYKVHISIGFQSVIVGIKTSAKIYNVEIKRSLLDDNRYSINHKTVISFPKTPATKQLQLIIQELKEDIKNYLFRNFLPLESESYKETLKSKAQEMELKIIC